MPTLKYATVDNSLVVTLVEGDEIIRTLTLAESDVADRLKSGEGEESPKLYGLRKKLQEHTSSIPDPEEKFEGMLECAEMLKGGNWRSDESRSRAVSIDPVLASAIASLKGISLASAVASLQALTKEQRARIKSSPAVIAAMADISANSAATEVVELSFE